MNKLMKRMTILVLLACLVSRLGMAQERMDDRQIMTVLHDRIEKAKAGVGIVVGVIDEKGPRVFSYGTLSLRDNTLVDGDTVFEIGSISKVFTTEVLADMVSKGEVKLDDPVAKFFPGKVKVPSSDGKQITLLDLADQHSGLPRLPDNMAPADGNNPYADYTVEQLYQFLSGYTLPREVGAKYEYSNLGMGLLGHALALKASKSYEGLVKERICEPLGMEHTGITLSATDRKRLATGHDKQGRAVSSWDIPTLAGAGALRSSVNDMMKFLEANLKLDEPKLKPAMEMAQAPQREISAIMKIGLGWHINLRHGAEIIWHNGGTGGYRSFLGFDQKRQRGVVVLSNSQNDIDDIGLHILEPMYELAKLEPAKPGKSVPVSDEVLAKHVGRYQLNATMFFNIRQEKDHLQVQLTGQSYLDMYPESETKFFLEVVKAQISFQQDANGKTISLTLHQNGANQKARKISDSVPGERMVAKVDPKIYDAYAGKYELAPNVFFTVKRQGDQLMVQLTGQSFYEVFPTSETKFFYKVVDAQLTFVKDGSGEVKSLILHQNGLNQEAKRVK